MATAMTRALTNPKHLECHAGSVGAMARSGLSTAPICVG